MLICLKSGISKLPFELEFDEFEDDYFQIENQRFYGFNKLSLKNDFGDKSILRETSTNNDDVEATHKSFYTLYVDHGEGPQYFGVYTILEDIDETDLVEQV